MPTVQGGLHRRGSPVGGGRFLVGMRTDARPPGEADGRADERPREREPPRGGGARSRGVDGPRGSVRVGRDDLAAVAAARAPARRPSAPVQVMMPLASARRRSGRPVAGLNGAVLIVSLMNRTEPSQKPMFSPPGWRLEKPW